MFCLQWSGSSGSDHRVVNLGGGTGFTPPIKTILHPHIQTCLTPSYPPEYIWRDTYLTGLIRRCKTGFLSNVSLSVFFSLWSGPIIPIRKKWPYNVTRTMHDLQHFVTEIYLMNLLNCFWMEFIFCVNNVLKLTFNIFN